MLTEEKIRQVKKQLRSGIPEGEIKTDLINQGFTEDEIKQVFAPGKYDMRSWYLVSAIIFLMAGLYAFANNKSLLLLVFSGVMFAVYFQEYKKHGH